MAELNNKSLVTKTKSDIRKRLEKIVELTEKIDKFISLMKETGTNVETTDEIMVEVQRTFVNIERESLFSYCNEQVLFLMKNLLAKDIKLDGCCDENVKKAFSKVISGYNEVKQVFESFALLNNQTVQNVDENLQKCYDQGKNIVEKLKMFISLTEDYFEVDSNSRQNAIGQLELHKEVMLQKQMETIRMHETIRDIRERLVIKFKRHKRAERKREESRLAALNELKMSWKKQITDLETKCADREDFICKLKKDAEQQAEQIKELREQKRQQIDQINKLTATLGEERMTMNTEQHNSKNLKLFISNLEKEISILNKSLESAEEIRLRIQTDMSRTQIEMADIRKRNSDLVAINEDYNKLRNENRNLHEDIVKSQENFKLMTQEFLEKEENLKKQLNTFETNYQIDCNKLESKRASQEPEATEFHDLKKQDISIELESAALKFSICEMHRFKKNQLGLAFALKQKVTSLRRRMRKIIVKSRLQAMTQNRKINKLKQAIVMEKQRNDELNLKLAKMCQEYEDLSLKAQENIKIEPQQIELDASTKAVEDTFSKKLAKLDEDRSLLFKNLAKNMQYDSDKSIEQIVLLQNKNEKLEIKNIELEADEERLKGKMKRMFIEHEKLQDDCNIQLATIQHLRMSLKSLESQPANNLMAKETQLAINEMNPNTFAEFEIMSRLQKLNENMLKMMHSVEELLKKAKTCRDHVAPNYVRSSEDSLKQILDIFHKIRADRKKCKNCSVQGGKNFNDLESKLVQLRNKAKDIEEIPKQFCNEWPKCYRELFTQSQQYRHDLGEIRKAFGHLSQQQNETVNNLNEIKTPAPSLHDKQIENVEQHNTLDDIVKTVPANLPGPISTTTKANESLPGPTSTTIKANESLPGPTLTTTKAKESVPFITRPTIGNNAHGKTFGDYRRDLLNCCRSRTDIYGLKINDFGNSWTNGLAFCALIHSYRPDLVNYNDLNVNDTINNLEKAMLSSTQLGLGSDFKLVANCLKSKRPKYMIIIQFIEKLMNCLEAQKKLGNVDV